MAGIARFTLVAVVAWNMTSLVASMAFPLDEFLNVSDYAFLDLYRQQYLCNGSLFPDSFCCDCRKDCMRYKSCCADALWGTRPYSNMSTYIDDFLEAVSASKLQECEEAIPPDQGGRYNVRGYLMVNNCPRGASTRDQHMCVTGGDSMLSSLPVLGAVYLYKNLHCAKCNSVVEFEMVPIAHRCVSESKTWGCIYEIDLYDSRVMPCTPGFSNYCPPGNKYYNMCKAFKGGVGRYRNLFCWLCNEGRRKFLPRIEKRACVSGSGYLPFSWSSLLRFSDSSNSGADRRDKKPCNKPLHKALEGECSVFCPDGYEATDSKCKFLSVYKRLDTNMTMFDKCLMRGAVQFVIINATDSLKQSLLPMNESGRRYLDVSGDQGQMIVTVKREDSHSTKDNIFSQAINANRYLGETGKIILSPTNMPMGYTQRFNLSHLYPQRRLCALPLSLHNNVTFTPGCNALYNGNTLQNWNLSLWTEIRNNSITRHVYSCQKYFLNGCPLRVLLSNVTIMDNMTLVHTINGTHEIFGTNDYITLTDGKYGVCSQTIVQEHRRPFWLGTVNSIEGYISVAGSSCSFLLYIFLIVTFSMFTELQNIPGLCALALCSCLFVADGLFLSANILRLFGLDQPTTACEIIGVLIHFSLLSSQLWGTLMSIDVTVNITSIQFARERHRKGLFIRYCLICFITPSLIIGMGILLRGYNILDVTYGENGICALNGFYGRLILYYSPLLVSFVISIALLGVTIYRLSRESRRIQHVLHDNGGINIPKITLKLIIIHGLSEGIGFINIEKNSLTEEELIVNSSFNMLYSIVKSFRGVMLFIVYVCRKPVLDLYRQRFSTVTPTQLEKTNNSSYQQTKETQF